MTADATASSEDYFERAKAALKSERDSMIQKIKEEIAASKRKALSKA
ncbi:MAG TPA: hypothetical protein VF172_12400 [Nitrososphaera sp.]|jgi:hypothetical protein